MLKIRLKLLGNKKNPSYSIILIDSKKKRNGKFIKSLGTYNRLQNTIILNFFLLKKNIQNGAQFTSPLKKLVIDQLLFKKINKI